MTLALTFSILKDVFETAEWRSPRADVGQQVEVLSLKQHIKINHTRHKKIGKNRLKALKTHLHDVLHQRCPAGQLVGLLAHSLLPVHLLSSAEGGLTEETWRCEGEIAKRTK